MTTEEATKRAERQVKVARVDSTTAEGVETYWELSNAKVCTRYETEDEAAAECERQRVRVTANLRRL